MKFEPGDRVKCAFFGDEVFELIKSDDFITYPIEFRHCDVTYHFTSTGLYDLGHTNPVLTLVEKKKEKEKIRLEVQVEWKIEQESMYGFVYPVFKNTTLSPDTIIGKRGKLIFEEE